MNDEAWNADFVRSIGMLLNGNAIEEVNENGELIVGDSLLILLNAHSDKVPFTLPPLEGDQQWQRVLDTQDPAAAERVFKPGVHYPLGGRAVAVLRVTPRVRERRRSRAAERAATRASMSSTRRNLSARKGDRGSRRPRVGNRESRAARQRRCGRRSTIASQTASSSRTCGRASTMAGFRSNERRASGSTCAGTSSRTATSSDRAGARQVCSPNRKRHQCR